MSHSYAKKLFLTWAAGSRPSWKMRDGIIIPSNKTPGNYHSIVVMAYSGSFSVRSHDRLIPRIHLDHYTPWGELPRAARKELQARAVKNPAFAMESPKLEFTVTADQFDSASFGQWFHDLISAREVGSSISLPPCPDATFVGVSPTELLYTDYVWTKEAEDQYFEDKKRNLSAPPATMPSDPWPRKSLLELLPKPPRRSMRDPTVQLIEDGNSLGVVTDAETSEGFLSRCAELLADLIEKGSPRSEWDIRLQYWLPQIVETACKLKGYKADVKERRLIIAGDFSHTSFDTLAAIGPGLVLDEKEVEAVA